MSWKSSVVYSGTFKIERSEFADFHDSSVVANGLDYSTRSFTDTALGASKDYYYRVTAVTGTAPTLAVVIGTTLQSGATPITIAAPSSGDLWANTAGGTAEGADGGDPMAMSYSGGGVRYSDGREFFSTTDLDPAESGIVSGVTRTWSSDPIITQASTRFGLGSGWMMSQVPTILRPDSDTIAVVQGGQAVQWFDKSGGAWIARYFGKDSLTEQSGGALTLNDTLGNSTLFNSAGRVDKWTDAGGNETSYSYADSVTYKPSQIERHRGTTAIGTVLERLVFGYTSGNLVSVAMGRLKQDGTTFSQIRSVEYGNTSSVTTATVKDKNGVDVDRKYYSYASDGRLMIVLEGDSYERALHALGAVASAGATALLPYSNLYFQFNADGQLLTEFMQGSGVYRYAYGTASSLPASNLNSWLAKTTEYLPDPTLSLSAQLSDTTVSDNNRNVVYSNQAGEVLAKTFFESDAATQGWTRAYQYDANGQLVLSAEPSAIQGLPNPSASGVINGDIVSPILRPHSGIVYLNSYNSTASPTAPGYLTGTAISKGASDSPINQSAFAYVSRPNSPGWVISSSALYQSDSGDPVTTTFAYGFYSGHAQVNFVETTLPTVSAAQNGDGLVTKEVTIYDAFGRPVWTRDADGYVDFVRYDDATGAATESIVDANPSTVSSPSVSGPTRTAGGTPLALSTKMDVDQLGRVTAVTDPMLHLTSTAYVDRTDYNTVTTTLPNTTSSSGALPPVTILRNDRATGLISTIRLTGGASPTITGVSVDDINQQGQLEARNRYASVDGVTYSAGSGIGGSGTFYRDTFSYDGRGRRVYSYAGRDLGGTSPTVTQTDYDALDRPVATWVGTDPTVSLNMTKVASMQYDGGLVGNGNLTSSTQYVDGTSSNNRVTLNAYDWRDRLVASKSGAQSSESEDVNRPVSYVKYDNLDRPLATFVFDGDTVNLADSNSDGVPDMPSASRARSASMSQYDQRGRVFRTTSFDVSQTSGLSSSGLYGYTDTQLLNASDATLATLSGLRTNISFDYRDNPVKSKAPGGLVTKYTYDGAGRVIQQATTDGGGDASLTDAKTLADDVVLEQANFALDGDGNRILVTTSQRHHDATTTGALDANTARVSFIGNWYDETDRLYSTVNWGNNAGTAITTRPGTIPSRNGTAAAKGFDTLLRQDSEYDAAGRPSVATDPRGIKIRTYYDALDRTIQRTESYTGDPTKLKPSDDSTPITYDENRKTVYTYNGFDEETREETVSFKPGNTSTSTPPSTQTQGETMIYGVAKSGNYAINSSALLLKTVYDTVPGETAIPGGDAELHAGYNALGESTIGVGRDSTTHTYTRDVLGRSTVDAITSANAQNSPWADAREFAYDVFGRPVKADMMNGTAVLNRVTRTYDGLGHLTIELQDHDGDGSDPGQTVTYGYDTNYGSNYSRQQTIQYPNGRVVESFYDYNGGIDGGNASFHAALNNRISRIGYISDINDPRSELGSNSGNKGIEAYDYLGLSTVVSRIGLYNNNTPWQSFIDSRYGDGSAGNSQIWRARNGFLGHDDAGASDPYTGLDRFGRYLTNGYESAEGRYFAYDADGNMLYSRVAGSNQYDTWKSQLFYESNSSTVIPAVNAYDKLGRMQAYYRGKLTSTESTNSANSIYVDQSSLNAAPGVPVPAQYLAVETFGPDENGYYKTDGAYSEIWRDQVYQKPLPPSSTQYTLPEPLDENRRDLFVTFDGWGQLFEQDAAYLAITGGTGYAYQYPYGKEYHYDAFGRRIAEVNKNRFSSSNPAEVFTTDLYYDQAGNVIEEDQTQLQDGTTDSNTAPVAQYVFSAAMSGTMVERDYNTDIDLFGSGASGDGKSTGDIGTTGSGLDQRLSVEQDLDGSVIRIFDPQNAGASSTFFVYSNDGQVTAQKANGELGLAPPDDWRYLWRGGRVGLDQRTPVDHDTGADVNPPDSYPFSDLFDGILLMPGGGVYDTASGAPVVPDVYAYYKTSGGTTGLDAHELNSRTVLANGYGPSAGTDPLWSPSAWDVLASNPVVQALNQAFAPDLAFAYTFFDEATRPIAGIAQAVTHPVQTFGGAVDSTSRYIAKGMADRGEEDWGWWSALEGLAYEVGSGIGARQMMEGASGYDLTTYDALDNNERIASGFGGLSQLAFLGSGLASTYTNLLPYSTFESARYLVYADRFGQISETGFGRLISALDRGHPTSVLWERTLQKMESTGIRVFAETREPGRIAALSRNKFSYDPAQLRIIDAMEETIHVSQLNRSLTFAGYKTRDLEILAKRSLLRLEGLSPELKAELKFDIHRIRRGTYGASFE
ncbi:MAG: repeat-associated core domain protein [Phycisphaerales bacterium]|nr:repeat-associated core domain protein [Phycisphaerales bacterium]